MKSTKEGVSEISQLWAFCRGEIMPILQAPVRLPELDGRSSRRDGCFQQQLPLPTSSSRIPFPGAQPARGL